MKKTIRLLTYTVVILLSSLSFADSERSQGAKSLFFDGDSVISSNKQEDPSSISSKKPKAKIVSSMHKTSSYSVENQFMGVSYSVDLIRNGQAKGLVSTNYPFISGDRIQLQFKTNKDGYLYVTHQGTTGIIKKLFPVGNQDILVKAGTTVLVPNNQMMHFDNNAGKENLWLTLSAVPLSTMQNPTQNNSQSTQNNYQQSSYQTASYSGCGSKDLLLDGGEGNMAEISQHCGSKDLVVEDDSNSTQPASYVVAPVNTLLQSAPIVVPITLTHN